MTTSRRDFLLTLGATALTPALASAAMPASPPSAAGSAARRAIGGIGVQMYMMRKAMQGNLEAGLARVARLGYERVEWWGNADRTAAQVRALLDANGLEAPTCHVGSEVLEADQVDATLDHYATIGVHTVIVAGMGRGYSDDADGWKRAAALLSAAGRKAAPLGMRIGYHNHDREFRKHGALSALEILMRESDPASVDLQLDCFWAHVGGQDPLAFLKAHPTRIAHLHLKDSARTDPRTQVDMGQGTIDWRALLRQGEAQRVVTATMDMDDPADPWASAGSARAYLRGIGY